MFPRQQEVTIIMEAVFSTLSVPKCYKQDQLGARVNEWLRELLRFSRELLLLEAGNEAGDYSGTERKGNVRLWKPLPSNGSEHVSVDTGV
jgi:hypothetical protein